MFLLLISWKKTFWKWYHCIVIIIAVVWPSLFSCNQNDYNIFIFIVWFDRTFDLLIYSFQSIFSANQLSIYLVATTTSNTYCSSVILYTLPVKCWHTYSFITFWSNSKFTKPYANECIINKKIHRNTLHLVFLCPALKLKQSGHPI